MHTGWSFTGIHRHRLRINRDNFWRQLKLLQKSWSLDFNLLDWHDFDSPSPQVQESRQKLEVSILSFKIGDSVDFCLMKAETQVTLQTCDLDSLQAQSPKLSSPEL